MQFLIRLDKNLILADILNLLNRNLIVGFINNLVIAAVFPIKKYITQQLALCTILTLSDMFH